MSEEPNLGNVLKEIINHQKQLGEEIERIYAVLNTVVDLTVETRSLLDGVLTQIKTEGEDYLKSRDGRLTYVS